MQSGPTYGILYLMANPTDLVKIKSGNNNVWYFIKDDQPARWWGNKDIIGTVIASMNDSDGDRYGLAQYWREYDCELLDDSDHNQYWRPTDLYLVQTKDGLLLTYSVKVIQKGEQSATKTKSNISALDKLYSELAITIAEDVKKMEAAGLSKDSINHMKKKFRLQ